MSQIEQFSLSDIGGNQEDVLTDVEEKEIQLLIKDLESKFSYPAQEDTPTIHNQICFDWSDASPDLNSLNVFNPTTDALHEVAHCLSVFPGIQEENTPLGSQKDVVDSIKDGFQWRKYGQKNVKNGKFSRSYYRCRDAGCTVTKFVDQTLDGVVRKIAYSADHQHSKPENIHHHTSRRSVSECKVTGEGVDLKSGGNVPINARSNQKRNLDQMESMVTPDRVDAFTQGCLPSNDDEDGKEEESERTGSYTYLGDPKIILRVKDHVGVLDDGYKWHKYGQKVLKGNTNPRNYYRCRNEGCRGKKYIQQDEDPNFVIAIYEGTHNHEVPVPKNSGRNNVGGCSSIQISHDPMDSESSQGRAKIPKIELLPMDCIPNLHHLEPCIGLPNDNFGMSSLGGCSSDVRPLPEAPALPQIPPPPINFFAIGSNDRGLHPCDFPNTEPIPVPQFTNPPSMDLLPAILAQTFHGNHPKFVDQPGPSNNKYSF